VCIIFRLNDGRSGPILGVDLLKGLYEVCTEHLKKFRDFFPADPIIHPPNIRPTLSFISVDFKLHMSTCPLGYGSPENSAELAAKAAKVELPANSTMSQERETSSIPSRDGKWMYPSPVQFYKNSVAKGHELDPNDMNTVVSIHNAVNEETWRRIVKIENTYHSQECPGGPTLVRFVGKPTEPSMKARVMHWIGGYVMPFDRHEWTIDRCGTGLYKYHVDFYDGSLQQQDKVNIYLDVRPSLDNINSVYDRVRILFNSFIACSGSQPWRRYCKRFVCQPSLPSGFEVRNENPKRLVSKSSTFVVPGFFFCWEFRHLIATCSHVMSNITSINSVY
jgi:cytochrome c heme-lyase